MGRKIARKGFGLLARSICLVAVLTAQAAAAGALTALPVRVDIAANQQFCSLTIGNDGTEDTTVQIRGYRWHQESGTDTLDDSAGVAVNPSIVTIPAGTKKLIRCSIPEEAGPIESSYRLIVSELPRATVQPGTLQTLLQLSIPVFRAQPAASPALAWELSEEGRLVVANNGTRHVRIAELVLRAQDAKPVRTKASFYLLAGARRSFDVSSGVDRIVEVAAMTEDGSLLAVRPEPRSQP